MNRRPLAFHCAVTLPPPSPKDKTADVERLVRALGEMGYGGVEVPLEIARRLPHDLRENGFLLDLVLGFGKTPKVLDVMQRDVYGLAVDIGSTNIECSLFDLRTGERMDAAAGENPQAAFGPDVLTRVQRSMMGEAEALGRGLLEGVNSLTAALCRKNNVPARQIYAVVVAGNTIMSHFFLGLDVNNIPLSPYIPAVNSAVIASGGESCLEVNRNAIVYVFPNAGSYVGGDIVSGILFSGVHREEEPVLFIDVGTNAEVVLGCRDWIMAGAGAAGPALESGVAGIGRKAEKGTISKVRIDRLTGEVELGVISDSEPSGICGSGLIGLVSELFSAGLIDQTGKFTGQGKHIVERNGEKAFLLYESGDRDLVLTEPEIRNFLVSKAAMFSFLYVFLKSVGLRFGDVRKVYVAGALGCGIDPESAVSIGMLPDIPRERFIPLGNSSLGGAEKALLDRSLLPEADEIAGMITYREMNEEGELMNMLQGAMFIPHTQPELLRG